MDIEIQHLVTEIDLLSFYKIKLCCHKQSLVSTNLIWPLKFCHHHR